MSPQTIASVFAIIAGIYFLLAGWRIATKKNTGWQTATAVLAVVGCQWLYFGLYVWLIEPAAAYLLRSIMIPLLFFVPVFVFFGYVAYSYLRTKYGE
jgi:hypothetical protein